MFVSVSFCISEQQKRFQRFLVSFYLIGCLGMIIGLTRPLFIWLTPWSLIISLILLLLFDRNHRPYRMVSAILTIGILGFAIEWLGVTTGKLFGQYHYGKGLGVIWKDVPLIIGINWFILVYCTAAIARKYIGNKWLSWVTAAALMVLYDVVLEQVASKLHLWFWKDGMIPLQNYLCWFVVALLFHGLFRLLVGQPRNALAGLLLICQIGFFVILMGFML